MVIGLSAFALAYIVGGIYTVKEYIWVYDFRSLTLSDLWSIFIIFTLWPLARIYWRMIR